MYSTDLIRNIRNYEIAKARDDAIEEEQQNENPIFETGE